jgi:predicted nucleic acid-binding protein
MIHKYVFLPETQSDDLDFIFRKSTSSPHSSANQWPDAYLAAFAATENLTLVTLDRSLHKIAPGSLLLGR